MDKKIRKNIKYYFLLFYLFFCNYVFSDANHLVLKRIAIRPDSTEMIAIYNPTNAAINLNDPNGNSYYLTDGVSIDSKTKHYTNLPYIKQNKIHAYSSDNNIPAGCGILFELDNPNDITGINELRLWSDKDTELNVNNYNTCYSQSGYNCSDLESVHVDPCDLLDNYIWIRENGQVWYNVNNEIYRLKFEIQGSNITNVSLGVINSSNFNISEKYWSETVYSDFFIEFPENTFINSKESIYISIQKDNYFNDYYGFEPDFKINDFTQSYTSFDPSQPIDYLRSDNAESLILFSWDGVSDIIKDIDYFLWYNNSYGIDKTNIPGYLSDLNIESQSFILPELLLDHHSFVRKIDLYDGSVNEFETESYGNGITGHNETSEDFLDSWESIFNPEKTKGCIDPIAKNYNPNSNADIDDGSCNYEYGCTNSSGTCLPNNVYNNDLNGCVSEYGENNYLKTYFNFDPDATKQYNDHYPNTSQDFISSNSSCIDTSLAASKYVRIKDAKQNNIPNYINVELGDGDPDFTVAGKIVGARLISDTFWILTLRDSYGYEIDVLGDGWSITQSKLSYLVDPYLYTEFTVSVYADFVYDETYGYQLSITDESQIDDYKRAYTNGEFVEDFLSINQTAKIVASPYVVIPSIGERLDFSYSFPANSRVIIRVFSLDGRFITTIIDRFYESSGTVLREEDNSDWDGRDHLGQIVSPGTYLFHMEVSNVQTGYTSTDVTPVVVGVNH